MATYCKHKKIVIGDEFDRLTVIGPVEQKFRNGQIRAMCLCRCVCGNECEVLTDALKRGNKKSCGCFRRDCGSAKNARHRMSRTQLHNTWCAIKRRCYGVNEPCYKRYGGRGIRVCDEWRASFEAFRDWALANGFHEGLTIERRDVNGHYCPENCTWIPQSEQALNRTTTRYVTADGETKTLQEWFRDPRCQVNKSAFYVRLKRGWSEEEAILEPLRGRWGHPIAS